jgi:histidine triad (HIT) family protein
MIKSNAPAGYACPICVGLAGADDPATLIRQTDVVYRDDLVTSFINSFFMGKNAGHAIVVPNQHYENIFDLPTEIGHRVFDVAQQLSRAMKVAYACDGITIKQNNEPAGDQHAFHFHLHVFPRYQDDGFNLVQPADKRLAEPDERATYAAKLSSQLLLSS